MPPLSAILVAVLLIILSLSASVRAAAIGAGQDATKDLENSNPLTFNYLKRRLLAESNAANEPEAYDSKADGGSEAGHALKKRYSNPAAPLLKGLGITEVKGQFVGKAMIRQVSFEAMTVAPACKEINQPIKEKGLSFTVTAHVIVCNTNVWNTTSGYAVVRRRGVTKTVLYIHPFMNQKIFTKPAAAGLCPWGGGWDVYANAMPFMRPSFGEIPGTGDLEVVGAFQIGGALQFSSPLLVKVPAGRCGA